MPASKTDDASKELSTEEKLIQALEENTKLRTKAAELEAMNARLRGSLKRFGVNPDKTEEPGKLEL